MTNKQVRLRPNTFNQGQIQTQQSLAQLDIFSSYLHIIVKFSFVVYIQLVVSQELCSCWLTNNHHSSKQGGIYKMHIVSIRLNIFEAQKNLKNNCNSPGSYIINSIDTSMYKHKVRWEIMKYQISHQKGIGQC